jgi:hypothetical protein
MEHSYMNRFHSLYGFNAIINSFAKANRSSYSRRPFDLAHDYPEMSHVQPPGHTAGHFTATFDCDQKIMERFTGGCHYDIRPAPSVRKLEALLNKDFRM